MDYIKTIRDYPEKEILIADLIHLTGGKVKYIIINDETGSILYEERAEYLEWTSDGVADKLCDKVVKSVDVSNDCRLIIYV